MKQRIRSWLIDLVRDAIRAEMSANPALFTVPTVQSNSIPTGLGSWRPSFTGEVPPVGKGVMQKPASNPVTDPSFEQMQSQALQEQEKYYAQDSK